MPAARALRAAGSFDRHAAGAERPLPREGLPTACTGLRRSHHRHQRRVGIAARVGGVQAGDVGQDDQQVGVDQGRDQRREVVVVAEAEISSTATVSFSLTIGTTPAPSSVAQRVPRVQVAAAVGEVVVGEEDLRDRPAVQREAPSYSAIRPDLADGGGGLSLRHRARALAPAEVARCRRRRRPS